MIASAELLVVGTKIAADASSSPPLWLQYLYDWVLILGAALGIGSFWIFRRSGPRIRIRAEYDSRNTLRIQVINAGRLNTTIVRVGVGTLRRKRIKRRLRRIPDVMIPDPPIPVEGPEAPLTIRPGEIYVWYGNWPAQDAVEAQVEPVFGESRTPIPHGAANPESRYIKAVVVLNDGCVGRKFKSWPANAPSFVKPATPPIAIDSGVRVFVRNLLDTNGPLKKLVDAILGRAAP
ncbi:hypothetical protein [Streptomyces sp. NBC_01431]|uniref:hypothetical protein n=1 Tax=Streptomyces sp. NBC_01431 TaxID=2903863 RepID=UPI002E302C42|nr:hypothetical protein [Streptomyces sp. NBC_01431]